MNTSVQQLVILNVLGIPSAFRLATLHPIQIHTCHSEGALNSQQIQIYKFKSAMISKQIQRCKLEVSGDSN